MESCRSLRERRFTRRSNYLYINHMCILMRSTEHVACIETKDHVQKVLVGKHHGYITLRRNRYTCYNCIKMNIKQTWYKVVDLT